MTRSRSVVWGILLSLISLPSVAQQPSERRIVTRTRLQVVFADLEEQWLKAVQAKDKPALEKLLVETFEVWSPKHGDPTPLDEWRKQTFSRPLKDFKIRQIAVRAVRDDVSVVSFVLSQTWSGSATSEDQFVVDIWTKDGEAWRCTDRYISPGTTAKAPTGDPRPNGKQ